MARRGTASSSWLQQTCGRTQCALQPHGYHLWENIFKKGQKKVTQAEDEGTKGMRNSPVNTKVRKKQREGGDPGARAEICLEKRFPCSPWKVWKRPQ